MNTLAFLSAFVLGLMVGILSSADPGLSLFQRCVQTAAWALFALTIASPIWTLREPRKGK